MAVLGFKRAATQTDTAPAARTVLAAAIVDAKAAVATATDARAAVARAKQMKASASERLDAARRDVDKVRATQTGALVSAATTGSALSTDNPMRKARLREMDETDGLEIATAALATVEEKLIEVEGAETKALERRGKAADAVLLETLPLFAARLDAAYEPLARFAAAYAFVAELSDHWDGPLTPLDRQRVGVFASKVHNVIDRRDSNGMQVDLPAPEAWMKAREALMLDAAAAIPEVGL